MNLQTLKWYTPEECLPPNNWTKCVVKQRGQDNSIDYSIAVYHSNAVASKDMLWLKDVEGLHPLFYHIDPIKGFEEVEKIVEWAALDTGVKEEND